MARATSAAPTPALVTVTHPVVTLRDQREGAFEFPTAPQTLRAQTASARISRDRFDADDALISFIKANGWADLKTQKILDSIRAKGHACGMSRLNKLLGRDSKGNALPAEADKA
ncbi:hypothetical protein B0G71_4348 [Paraburkholderia sp. BL27I4N3]|uniref:hypothetical protein n=1 Tax=Paraburkholderia sp. BL27I4N3 TaxID=1938805 RepID=UPI000E25B8A1|nr:hypothetical protein [Paraburkholderia sp. BL27I4N3]REE21196.1 hypothetical protein B0G71_4348 [Paraburkholderia sp. BL27I4N3]